MMRLIWGLMLLCCSVFVATAQQGPYAPQADLPGNNSIHRDDSTIRDWAISCEVQRGWRQINQPDSGKAGTGAELNATGKADGAMVVSLGDSGVATLQFTAPMFDGPGADFAVFENGFGAGESAYLELAFVEVSSDGEHFYRFPAYSAMQDTTQIAGFEYTDASYYSGLAGKYINGYGVPFDLSDLPDTALLDKLQVSHVRIVDVIGSIQGAYASRDSDGKVINDPWPTNFPSSGFDLDAVGIINSTLPLNVASVKARGLGFGSLVYFDLHGRVITNLNDYNGIYFEKSLNGSIVKRFKLEN